MKKVSKQGIALLSLILIIVIVMMLAGLVTYSSYDMIFETQKLSFAKDITTINDAVEEYYSVNGSLPILNDGNIFTVQEYKNKIEEIRGSSQLEQLAHEMDVNDDESAVFYEIDISKLDIKQLKYGLKEDEYDIFLVSDQSNKVYYLKGYDILNKVYFSGESVLNKNI